MRSFTGLLCSIPILLAVFFLGGCEEADVSRASSSRKASQQSIVQGRVNEDGQFQAVIALAPQGENGEAADLSALRGMDLFERGGISTVDGVRKRAPSNRNPDPNPGTVTMGGRPRILKHMNLGFGLVSQHFSGRANAPINGTVDRIICYASSPYLAFDHSVDFSRLPGQRQTITFSHGNLEATAEVFKSGQGVFARVNGGPQIPVFEQFGSDFLHIGFIVPVQGSLTPLGTELPELRELLGTWRVEGSPQFYDHFDDIDRTPFEFTMKALVVKDLAGTPKGDIVDEVSGERYTGGATFTGRAKIVSSSDLDAPDSASTRRESDFNRLVLKAEIFQDKGEIVDTIYESITLQNVPNINGDVTPLDRGFTIDWDATGQLLPADAEYGVAVTAMLDRDINNDPLDEAQSYIYTLAPAVGPGNLSPAFLGEGLSVEPQSYVPYTEEEINNWEFNEFGEPQWIDNDGDGTPNWPDHDGDEEADFDPGDDPPPIFLAADLVKPGFETSWTLRVLDEEGIEIFEGVDRIEGRTPPWSGDEFLEIEWQIPQDLDPQNLTFQLDVTRCRESTFDLQILGQTTGELCTSSQFEGEVAYGAPLPTWRLFSGARITSPAGLGIENKLLSKVRAATSGSVSAELSAHSLPLDGQEKRVLALRSKAAGLVHDEQSWRILAQRIRFKDQNGGSESPPERLHYKVKRLATGAEAPSSGLGFELRRGTVYDDKSADYSGQFSLPENFLATPAGVNTELNIGEIYRDKFDNSKATPVSGVGATELYETLVQGLGFAYPPSFASYGTFAESAIDALFLFGENGRYPDGVPTNDVALPRKENLRHLGFETLEFSLVENDLLESELSSIPVKVPQQANQVMWNFHGGHSDGRLYMADDRVYAIARTNLDGDRLTDWTLSPSDLSSNAKQVECFLFLSCAILDIADFNNSTVRAENGVWPGPESRKFGGIAWASAVGNLEPLSEGNVETVLLGYNQDAPFLDLTQDFETHPPQIISEYREQLTQLQSSVPPRFLKQYAWMVANLRYAESSQSLEDLKSLALQACAIDRDYYYYIPFGYLKSPKRLAGKEIPFPDLGSIDKKSPVIYRVPKSDWDAQLSDWRSNRNANAEVVPELQEIKFQNGASR